jgi:nucleoside phosphorylase
MGKTSLLERVKRRLAETEGQSLLWAQFEANEQQVNSGDDVLDLLAHRLTADVRKYIAVREPDKSQVLASPDIHELAQPERLMALLHLIHEHLPMLRVIFAITHIDRLEKNFNQQVGRLDTFGLGRDLDPVDLTENFKLLMGRLDILLSQPDFTGEVGLILAGTKKAFRAVESRDTSLARGLGRIMLQNLAREEALALIRPTAQDVVSAEVAERIWLETGGHPYLVQFIMRELVNQKRGEMASVERRDVRAILTELSGRRFLQTWYRNLDPLEVDIYGHFVWLHKLSKSELLDAELRLPGRGNVSAGSRLANTWDVYDALDGLRSNGFIVLPKEMSSEQVYELSGEFWARFYNEGLSRPSQSQSMLARSGTVCKFLSSFRDEVLDHPKFRSLYGAARTVRHVRRSVEDLISEFQRNGDRPQTRNSFEWSAIIQASEDLWLEIRPNLLGACSKIIDNAQAGLRRGTNLTALQEAKHYLDNSPNLPAFDDNYQPFLYALGRGLDGLASKGRQTTSRSRGEIRNTPSATNIGGSESLQVDVVILTVKDVEYEAVKRRLKKVGRAPMSATEPNLYAWVLGHIPTTPRGKKYSVMLGMIGRVGNINGALSIREAIDRWHPRYIFLTGYAGGFALDGLQKGDVVISETIYGYEYGKLAQEFIPRHDWTYHVDQGLLTGTMSLLNEPEKWAKGVELPDGRRPKAITGNVASGDKVVDNPTNEFFKKVLEAWAKLHAIEMEGVGAGAAIEQAHARGIAVGFIMIRGISDMPRAYDDTKEWGTQERDTWKGPASEAAAAFTVALIANGLPIPPAE